MTIPWSERASFIPYPRPVVPPTSDIQDAPLVSLCLNEDWAAYALGCLKTLARPETWNADQDTINAAVEQAMRIAFLLEDGCMTTEQFRQQDDCLLQRSIDGGVSWDTVFDASSCVDALIKSGRYGQFGPGVGIDHLSHGACDTRRITLYANTPYQSPFLLETDDTVTLDVIFGIWSGTLNQFSDTHCADGGFLDAFAQCGGSADPGHTGDPLPSSNHMRLVAQINGTWYDAYNATLTVPGSVVDATFTLQANDDVLLDNVGYAIIDVTVCKAGWTHHFTGSDLHTNFHLYNDGTYGDRGVWSGSQYDSVVDPVESPDQWLYLYINPPSSTYLSYDVDATSIFGRSWSSLIRVRDGTNGNGSDVVSSGTDTRLLTSTQVNPPTILIGVVNNGAWLIDGITLTGQGADPF